LYVSESFQNYSFISFESAVKKYSRIAQLGEKLFHLETLAWRRRRQLSGGNVANGCKQGTLNDILWLQTSTCHQNRIFCQLDERNIH
jgi:hypothetical protein